MSLGTSTGRRTSIRAIPWIVVIGLGFVGLRLTAPPAPVEADAPADSFSAERAFDHVEGIATVPHPMGSAAIAETRTYIIDELTALGVEVDTQVTSVPDYFGTAGQVDVVDIVARIRGVSSSGTVALMAHYDTVPTTTGANDDTAAVAALLETARALTASEPLANDLMLIFTDGEEPAPQYGSSAFVASNPAFDEISLIVNLEATGRNGASVLVETSGPQTWLIEQLDMADDRPAAFSFLTETSSLLGEIGTDFDAFRNTGTPGFHFAYIHTSSGYHLAADNISAVDLGSLQHHGEHTLAIAHHFGDLDLREMADGDRSVFFSVGPVLIHYPESWTVPIAFVTMCLVGFGLHRSGRLRPGSGRRPLRALVAVIGSLASGTAIWLVVAAVRPSPGIVVAYVTFAGALALSAAIVATAGGRSDGWAVIASLTVLAAMTAVEGRGFSYLFALPLLAVAIGIWWRDGSPVSRNLRFALVAGITILTLMPAVDLFLQLAHPRTGSPDSNMPVVVVLPLALGLLGIRVLAAFWPHSDAAIEHRRPDRTLTTAT